MMRCRIIGMSLLLCMTSFLGTSAMAGGAAVTDPLTLGRIELRLTVSSELQKDYLGVSATEKASLAQIKAERLIIVVFNVFCTVCQSDASVLNLVHETIEEDPNLRGRIKLLGIATGNTDMEVEQFQEQHRVQYPLMSDPDFSLERAVTGNLRTPMIIIARNVDGKSLQVVKTNFGATSNVADLLSNAVSGTTVDRALVQVQKD